jgi:hypothetical protein
MTGLILLPVAFALAGLNLTGSEAQGSTAERRALKYLAREVPRWFRENKCRSCHNNGDAARALYTAVRLSCPVPTQALEETSHWLARPQQWDHNGGEGPFTDKKLARIQFAAALADGFRAGSIKDRQALTRAAELVVEQQSGDGSWQIDAPGTLGSPATYGPCLATYQARRVLEMAGAARYRQAIAKANQWLEKIAVKNVLDAAAILLALEPSQRPDLRTQRLQCLKLIREGESEQGGWGPYVHSPAEPFDTAIVLLALGRRIQARVPLKSEGSSPLSLRSAEQEAIQAMIGRGRAYLVATQRPDGSWPETTRPPGSESYAQRLSTTAWATLALLATR